MKKIIAALIFSLSSLLMGQNPNPPIVAWPSATPPTTCGSALPLYIIANGFTGAGNIYGNASATTGTSCSQLNNSGGSMTWPTGGAGVPNYGGSNAWATTYNASNPIPANFISTLNQNTTGTSGGLTGTPNISVGTIAATGPVTVSGAPGYTMAAGTAPSGAAGSVVYTVDATNGYAEVNENNTGISRVCTAANGICPNGVSSGTVGYEAVYSGSTAAVVASHPTLDCSQFTGADVGVKWNSCVAAAIAVDGVADGRALLAGSHTYNGEMECGDASEDPVECLMPPIGVLTDSAPDATFTATGSGTNLTVTAVTGTLCVPSSTVCSANTIGGHTLSGTGIPQGTTLVSQTSGTLGGAGVYVTSLTTTASGASVTAGFNAFKQWPYSTVTGDALAGANSFSYTTGPSNVLYQVGGSDERPIASEPKGGKYLSAKGIAFDNFNTATINGITASYVGYQDGTTIDEIGVYTNVDATGFKIGACCGAVVKNLVVNANYTAGITPCLIESDVTTGVTINEDLILLGPSCGHPGATLPNIKLVAGVTGNQDSVQIIGAYLESSTTVGTQAMILSSGLRNLTIHGALFRNQASSGTFQGVSIDNTYNTGLVFDGGQFMYSGNGTWSLPATCVTDANTGTPPYPPSDAYGNCGSWEPGTSTTFASNTGASTITDLTATADTLVTTVTDNGSGASVSNFNPTNTTAGQGNIFQFCRTTNDTGGCSYSFYQGNNTSTKEFGFGTNGVFNQYHAKPVAGNGVAAIPVSPAVITTGSGTSIGSTSFCTSTNCGSGLFDVHAYLDVTTACTTGGTYQLNLIYTDDQGSKTITAPLTGTGVTLNVLGLASTSNFGMATFPVYSTGSTISYSTTAGACSTGGPMVGNLRLSMTAVN